MRQKKLKTINEFPKEVGKKITHPFQEDKIFNYCHVLYEEDGWVDITRYLPLRFDLITLKIKNKNNIIHEYRGWWTGSKWEGYRFTDEDKVLGWKKTIDDKLDHF
ncbi:MAG: hypothetical protein ACE5RC_00005 [Nitrosopumilus sp.]